MIPMRSGDFGDLASLVEMNAAQSAGYRFALARDADYIRQAITKKRLLAACGRPGHRTVEFLVVEEGGRAAAYAVLFEVGEFAMITECGDRDPVRQPGWGATAGRAGARPVETAPPARLVADRASCRRRSTSPPTRSLPIAMMVRPLGCERVARAAAGRSRTSVVARGCVLRTRTRI